MAHHFCSMTVDGVPKLAELIQRSHINDLNLYMNDLGDEGIKQASDLPCVRPSNCSVAT